MCMGLTTNFAGLVVCRVFLGIFEAGVFPGTSYHLFSKGPTK
jgi:MFS family permease